MSHAQPSAVNAPGNLQYVTSKTSSNNSFFAPNRSQTESQKNDTEEEMDGDQRKLKKSRTSQKTWLRDHMWLRYEKEAMF